MNLEEILKNVLEKLNKHKIAYMITGSFASNFYSIPRTTFDLDIIIEPSLEKIENFLKEIEDDFYFDLEAVKEAVDNRGMFNIIHYETAFKIDFIIRKRGDYYEREFNRRKKVKFEGVECYIASPEDTILSKLLWAKMGESEKQFKDALLVAKVQKKNIDFEYLNIQAKKLNIEDLLKKLLNEIEEMEQSYDTP